MTDVRLRGWGWRHPGRRAWALRGVDLEVSAGERVLLLGPSGAGKSTLLAALGGLLDPNSGEHEGEIRVGGLDPRAAREQVGTVFQDPEAHLVMARCGDDVAFGLENRGVPRADLWPRVDESLHAVDFPYGRDHPTSSLSGGEKQRLALAGVLALRPRLLLLDEPTANLDPAGAAGVRDVLGRVLAGTGATLVLVEHRVDAVMPLVDRVVVLEPGGGLVADGPPGRVFAEHGRALADAGVWVPGRPPGVPRRSPGAGPVLLEAEDAAFRFPDAPRQAVVAPYVALRAAEALAFVGPSGAGKSTLAVLLAGLLAPTAGTVRATPALAGAAAAVPPARWRARTLVRHVGTVFQDPEHQFLTGRVRDELLLGPCRTGLDGPSARARADDLLARLRLDRLADANPFTLSGGEKRRLSVATALTTGPRVLVLDEPTFGQDRRTWCELVDLLAALRDAGSGVVLVTHDLDVVAALADREHVVRDGRVADPMPAEAGRP